ncbi:uncharacterized protein TNCV_929071 [Trichonephila clavipes]|nr:uncharacterized protein TNCV_929071 [Trichonephila clavipes]
MLFQLLESCLPAEILRAWERYVGYSSDESGKKDLDSLMKFLSIEVSSEDRTKLAWNSFDSEKSNYKKKLGNLSTTATAADLFNSSFKNRKDFKFKNNNNDCIFCEKTHASENCCEVASISDVKCIICNKRHYAVLCSKLPLRSGLETESASIENSTTASSSSSNVLANQACTSEVLLQTLVVMLQNGNHKSLLDSLGITDPVETKTKLEIQKETLNHFQKTISVDISGRYEVAFPWVLDNKLLSSNRKLAENRLESTKRKLIATELESQPDNFETMVLGLIWNLKDDCLSCNINCQKNEGKAITKRSLLSIANHIFDPIGFTAPVTLKPKLILQEIWKLKLKWDENLPKDILNQVKKWLEQLPILASIKIPRCLNLSSNGIKRLTLHVFCDASKKAYAACVFLRVEYEENVFVKLIQAKARVAPLKDISIPRLELLSCTIGTRLAASVKNDLNLPDVRIYYLTDSMTALAWIQRTRD